MSIPLGSSMRIIHLAFLLCLSFSALAESVRIQIVDVGQADGIVIRTPNKKNWIVIDAGTSKKLADYLVDMGVTKLDMAVVTHRHFDHQGGMDEVISKIPTDLFVGITEDCPGRTSDNKVRQALSDNSVSVLNLSNTPQTLSIDGIDFTILPLPPRSPCPQNENSNSIVIRLNYGNFSMLFTGDAEEDELNWLIQNYSNLLDVDILKASHHGSNNGVTDEFLSSVTPERVVISAGVNAKYKHPMEEAVKDYMDAANDRVYCTNRHGTIRIYGFTNGGSRIFKQNKIDKSCVYDGTHY